MSEIVVLSEQDLEKMITLQDVIPLVEKGFVDYHHGAFVTFPVVREKIDRYKGVFGIKSGYLTEYKLLGFKAGGYWKNNPVHGIPGHRSVVVLFDPETGNVKAMMDGNFITVIRTGAVGAIAAKYLARRSSETAAILGCGTQGRVQLAALKKVLSLKSVKCFDNLTERAEDFAVEMGSDECRVVVVSSPEDALREADVIVTTTPSEKWIVANEWITPGMHISAMGADTRGKQEIDPLLFSRARIVVDSLEQSQQLGEMQHVPEWIGNSCIYATLGEVVAGEKKGRFEENDITLFDATGIAFQDLVTAGLALERAVATKIGTWVKI